MTELKAMPVDAPAAKKKVQLQRILPYVVITAFGFILIFVVVAVVVSGLVLGGTIEVDAKAIGLTQSLVLISSIFSITYVGLHTYTARKAQYVIDRQHREYLPPMYTKIITLSRITAGFWTTAVVAVAITLGGKSASSSSTSLGALRADIAACIVNCLCMAIIILIIERTSRPFVLPRITPSTLMVQTSSAKALIQDIIGDGVSGHTSAESTHSNEESTTLVAEGCSTRPGSLKSQGETTLRGASTADITERSEPEHIPRSTPAERQRLWRQVDEGGRRSPVPVPPMPPSPAKMSPQPAKRQSYSAAHRASASHSPLMQRPEGSSYLGTTPMHMHGARSPGPPVTGHTRYLSAFTESDTNRLSTVGENAEGKRLFNRAVENLRDSEPRRRSKYDDWSNMKIPGTFSGW